MKAVLLVSVSLVAASCGGTSAPTEPTAGHPAPASAPPATGLARLAHDACACTSPDCLAAVDARLHAWASTTPIGDATADDPPWPLEHEPETSAAIHDLMTCFTRGHAAPRGFAEVNRRLRAQLRDALCACPDRACGLAVSARVPPVYEHWTHREATEQVHATLSALADEISACAARAAASDGARAVAELTAIRDRGCACTDLACANQVEVAFLRFAEEHRDTKGDAAEGARVAELANELADCLTRAAASAP